ncbi:hypothetical protein JCM19314_1964 [Nonlabens ulvanivorans]|uniref:Uncharacterized protein n=1 Tax=Nonlabens ulvanivorans TaxID=906888 RepID=A0A090QBK8_NONUL|nr:hypothetical protein JCM19314_1964 [Nonlabens ulvanivorans]
MPWMLSHSSLFFKAAKVVWFTLSRKHFLINLSIKVVSLHLKQIFLPVSKL